MSEPYLCLDCRVIAPLTVHGECATCFSAAVVPAEHRPNLAAMEIEQLENMLQVVDIGEVRRVAR